MGEGIREEPREGDEEVEEALTFVYAITTLVYPYEATRTEAFTRFSPCADDGVLKLEIVIDAEKAV